MDSTPLYAHILGLSSPWHVSAVGLDTAAGEVRIRVTHGSEDSLQCPQYDRSCSVHDHRPSKAA